MLEIKPPNRDSTNSPETFAKLLESSDGRGSRSPNMSNNSMRSSVYILKCKKAIKVLDRKFKDFNIYQDIVKEAALEAVGKN